MTLNELAAAIHENARNKGFYDEGQAQNVGEKLMLMVSEVSEALEAHREGRHARSVALTSTVPWDEDFVKMFKVNVKDSHEDELADVIIRALDYAAWQGIDIDTHVAMKMRYNTTRPYKHGKAY